MKKMYIEPETNQVAVNGDELMHVGDTSGNPPAFPSEPGKGGSAPVRTAPQAPKVRYF